MGDLYRFVINSLPLDLPRNSDPESFVLAPPDFGSRNILCDDGGNITALLDWDTLNTSPRLTGWSLPPDWLCYDWYGEDRYCWPNYCLSPKQMETYCSGYARYLQAACGDDADDWKYTTRSPMYQQILMAIDSLEESHMLRIMECFACNPFATH
jgi:hypothetical protein